MPAPIELSCLELSPTAGLARIQPPQPGPRPPDYQGEFDSHTVLYDAFRSADAASIVLLGPPLANLEPFVLPALRRAVGDRSTRMTRVIANWLQQPPRMEVRTADRHAQLWLRCDDGIARE